MTDYELNVNFDDYCFCEEEGTFKAVLDFARYGKKKNVIAYFTFEDGRKIMACAWNNMSYLGLNRIPIGTELYLTFAKKKSDSCYLRNVEIAE